MRRLAPNAPVHPADEGPATGVLGAVPAGARINPDEGVTAPEDPIKEHGVLDRCLLAQHPDEFVLQREASPTYFPPLQYFNEAVDLRNDCQQ